MKVIIAEKPSVAKDIARILNVSQKKDGYLEGNGYAVTWAFGHLGELADAKTYVDNPWAKESLPIIPEQFKYQVKQDAGARKQFKVIKELFTKASEIIVATDAGREGENIFRIIYRLAGSKTPFKRLWISSLTDAAIREGFSKLKDGRDYDRLAFAAEGREKADWLVGINATIALTLANSGGSGVLSLGRVQTPTLAIICERYLHNINFKPEPYFVPQLILDKDKKRFKANYRSQLLIKKSGEAADILQPIGGSVTCTRSEKKPVTDGQPLLYDLTTLQSDCNKKFAFSASKTLKVMQGLYETHKVLTYPRTDSRYISEDIYSVLPQLFKEVNNIAPYGSFIQRLDLSTLPKKSVNDAKVSDHHAIIPTGKMPHGLSDDEQKIFDLVTRRFIAAFSAGCKKEVTSYVFNDHFHSSGTVILEMGWRGVEQDIKEEDQEDEENQTLPVISEGENVTVVGKTMLDKKTKPKPIHTESSLLKAMETAGKDVDDLELREAMKEKGIGTPATRASIIETLIASRQYVERKKKQLIPTEKGLSVYQLVKDKRIASPELTGDWESKLKLIESGKYRLPEFLQEIGEYTKQILSDLSQVQVTIMRKTFGPCPKCTNGEILEGKKGYGCNRYKEGCDFVIWNTMSEKKLAETAVKSLLRGEETAAIKGFKSKAGKSFEAALKLNRDTYKVEFVFAERVEPKQETKTIAGSAWEITELNKVFKCCKEDQEIKIWKEISNKKITREIVDQLLTGKPTGVLKGFKSKAKKPFEARLLLNFDTGKVEFQFEQRL